MMSQGRTSHFGPAAASASSAQRSSGASSKPAVFSWPATALTHSWMVIAAIDWKSASRCISAWVWSSGGAGERGLFRFFPAWRLHSAIAAQDGCLKLNGAAERNLSSCVNLMNTSPREGSSVCGILFWGCGGNLGLGMRVCQCCVVLCGLRWICRGFVWICRWGPCHT